MDGGAVSFDLDDTVANNPAQDAEAEFVAIMDCHDHGNTIGGGGYVLQGRHAVDLGDIDPVLDDETPEAAWYSYLWDQALESPRGQERGDTPDDDEGRGAPWFADVQGRHDVDLGDIDPILDDDSPDQAAWYSYIWDHVLESPRGQDRGPDTPDDDDETAVSGAPWYDAATVADETTLSDESAELPLLVWPDDASWFSSAEPAAAWPESTTAPDDDVQWQGVVMPDQETQDYNDELLAYYLSVAYPDSHDVIPAISDPESYILRDGAIAEAERLVDPAVAAGTMEMPSPRGLKRGRDTADDAEEGRTRGAPRHATAGTVEDSPSAGNLEETALTTGEVWFSWMDQGTIAASSPDWFIAAASEATALVEL